MQLDNFTTMTSEAYLALTESKTKPSKYRNHKMVVNGEKYDSEAEYHRHLVLLDDEAQSEIHALRRQVPFELVPRVFDPTARYGRGGWRPVTVYVADFVYFVGTVFTVEDVKHKKTMTPLFRLKWKLMLLKYPDFSFKIVLIG